MDTKIEIKEEDPLSDDVASQNEREFFLKGVTMKTSNDCDTIKTEIKSESPFPGFCSQKKREGFTKPVIKQMKFETVTCSKHCETNKKMEIEEQYLVSDFGSQKEREFLPEDPVMKIKKYNRDPEVDNTIEIKEEPWWLETETSSVCDDVKDGDFPPVKSSYRHTDFHEMTARPLPNDVLSRVAVLEEKVQRKFNLLQAQVRKIRKYCEKRHLQTHIIDQENYISIRKVKNDELEERIRELTRKLAEEQKCNKELARRNDYLKNRIKDLTQKLTQENKVNGKVASQAVAAKNELLFIHSVSGNEAEVKSIIASGADVNIVDETGKTPLHYAVYHGHPGICECLLKRGADIHACDDNNITPLHLACSQGHLPVVKLLVSRGASVRSSDSNRYTPLHCAAIHGHIAICEHLLMNRARVNACDINNYTPLHLACYKGHFCAVKMLISYGASINFYSTKNYTPLHCAAMVGCTSVCDYLLRKGAKLNAGNHYSPTPVALASHNGHFNVVELLIKQGAHFHERRSQCRTMFSDHHRCSRDY